MKKKKKNIAQVVENINRSVFGNLIKGTANYEMRQLAHAIKPILENMQSTTKNLSEQLSILEKRIEKLENNADN